MRQSIPGREQWTIAKAVKLEKYSVCGYNLASVIASFYLNYYMLADSTVVLLLEESDKGTCQDLAIQ